MALFDRSALNPGVARREVAAWALYDFANSGYTTVVLTAVFSAYFVGVVAAQASWATLAWTLALALSNLAVMLTMPAIGERADRHGTKKPLLALATLGCVLSTAALFWCGAGDLALAVVLIVVSNYCYSMGETLCGAFLPELARPASIGKVSGWGWSFGYFGGMLALGLSLGYVIVARGRGETAAQFVPVTMLITAAIYAVAALPTFLLLKERARASGPARVDPMASDPGTSIVRLLAALSRTRSYPDFRRFLWTGFAYQAGISVVVALAAIYAEQAMGFTQTDTMMLIFLVNIAAALGAFTFGYVQDRVGHKAALALTLYGWIGMVLLAGLGESRALFWAAATVAGLCMGSSQSAGRALVGVFAPSARLAEFFGLWALSTRAAAIVGPLTYGLVNWVTDGNHRLAILITGLFFVAGLLLLARVDVHRGTTLGATPTPTPAEAG
ncbi:MAG: MFS transporter [Lautropia sp.]